MIENLKNTSSAQLWFNFGLTSAVQTRAEASAVSQTASVPAASADADDVDVVDDVVVAVDVVVVVEVVVDVVVVDVDVVAVDVVVVVEVDVVVVVDAVVVVVVVVVVVDGCLMRNIHRGPIL